MNAYSWADWQNGDAAAEIGFTGSEGAVVNSVSFGGAHVLLRCGRLLADRAERAGTDAWANRTDASDGC